MTDFARPRSPEDGSDATFDEGVLNKQIKHAMTRYAGLLEQSRGAYGAKPSVQDEALHELSLAIEELNVTEEELRVQNQALRDAYFTVEQERAHYQDLFDLLPDAYIVTDAYGSVLDANKSAEEMLQVSTERLRGKPLAVYVEESDRRDFRDNIAQARSTRGRVEWNSLIVPRSGSPLRATFRVAALHDENSTHRRLGWIIRDTTEKQRAATLGLRFAEEQTARIDAERASRRFRVLAEASRQLTAETDVDVICGSVAKSVVRFTSDHCEILLLQDGALKSMARINRDPRQAPFSDALRRRHNMMADNRDSLVWRALETGEAQVSPRADDDIHENAERRDLFASLRSNGPRNAVAMPLMFATEKIGVMVVMSTEPTAQFGPEDVGVLLEIATRAGLAIGNARLVKQLETANNEKADFLAVLSHELRTPLTAVIGYSDLLLSGIPEPLAKRAQEHVERIRTCSWHQLSVVEQILRYARIESGADHPVWTEVDLETLVHEATELVEAMAREKKIEIAVDLPAAALKVKSDAGRLRQILANLLTNALKFTDEGAVSLTVRRTDADMFFSVSDTGIGIAAHDIGRVFDPFWRAAAEDRVQRAGMGLGLAVSERLARSISGELTVQSQLGVGTSFTLRVPIR